ncbi:MAG: DUF2249 domain-containing protein [Elusimicrobia bacterium]|nr:DUF2249 domain-containing protein [Elusimicrobiota bacterium]
MKTEILLDIRTVPPHMRHQKIFAAWESLPAGGLLKLVSDHDPAALLGLFRAERVGEFEWIPLVQGPAVYSVAIRRVVERSHPLTVDEEDERQPTNEQEEDGGGYARPRECDVPGKGRPSRGGSLVDESSDLQSENTPGCGRTRLMTVVTAA